MNTNEYWAQVNAKKGGRLKLGVNIPVLNNLKLPLPPLDEQEEIAAVLAGLGREQRPDGWTTLMSI
jgi:type I restriction enzyme S subunit